IGGPPCNGRRYWLLCSCMGFHPRVMSSFFFPRKAEARMGKGQFAGIDPDQYTQGGYGHSDAWTRPRGAAFATLILAHGAGAPMDSPFMQSMAERLAARGIAVYRFEFDYMAE